jgi:hypothetical protein
MIQMLMIEFAKIAYSLEPFYGFDEYFCRLEEEKRRFRPASSSTTLRGPSVYAIPEQILMMSRAISTACHR